MRSASKQRYDLARLRLNGLIERFDGTNELAVVWVQVPVVAPGSDRNILYAYAGNDKAAADAHRDQRTLGVGSTHLGRTFLPSAITSNPFSGKTAFRVAMTARSTARDGLPAPHCHGS